MILELAHFRKTQELQERIKQLEEEKDKLDASLTSEKERSMQLNEKVKNITSQYHEKEREAKLANKKLEVGVNRVIKEVRRYYLGLAKFYNGQGFRLVYNERGRTKERRKYKNPKAYDQLLKVDS